MEPSSSPPVIRRVKIIAYLVVWLVALFATNPSGGLLALVYMFPMGLASFIYPPLMRDEGWTVFVGCYAIYIVHGVLYFRSRTSRFTYLWLGILALLLICNVAGCRGMINAR